MPINVNQNLKLVWGQEQKCTQQSHWNFKSQEFQKLNLKMENKISFEKATLI